MKRSNAAAGEAIPSLRVVGGCVASTAQASELDEGPAKREHPAAHGEVLTNPLGVIFGSYGVEIGIGLADGVSLNRRWATSASILAM